MPIYEYRCRNCGYEFDKFLRTFETGDVNCPRILCQKRRDRLLQGQKRLRAGSQGSRKGWQKPLGNKGLVPQGGEGNGGGGKMKIVMMTPWNRSCGVAMHAELIGREWIRMGHELNVLAPIEKETQPVTNTNEPYVTRCYTMDREFIKGMLKSLSLNPRPFLDLDYELFIVQNLEPSVA